MSEITLLIARSFAIFYIVIGIGMLANAKVFAKYLKDLEKNKGIMFMGSGFVLMLGAVLVLLHNEWGKGPALLVTFVAWFTLIKGTFFFLFPEHMLVMLRHWEAKESISAAGGLLLVLGALFAYIGFVL